MCGLYLDPARDPGKNDRLRCLSKRRRTQPPRAGIRVHPPWIDICSAPLAALQLGMTTKSREYLYGNTIRMSAERARDAGKEADRLACEAWNKRMLGYKGPAQPSPMLGDALNAGYCYLEVRCLGCDTHQTVALNIVRRPKGTTPIHELERYMRCKNCSELQNRPFKRSHLVASSQPGFLPPTPPRCGGRRNAECATSIRSPRTRRRLPACSDA